MVAYERSSLTRGSKYSDLTWKRLAFWKLVAEQKWSLTRGGCNLRFNCIRNESTTETECCKYHRVCSLVSDLQFTNSSGLDKGSYYCGVVWISDFLYFNFISVLVLIEKMYQTLNTVFHHSSKHLEALHCTSYFQLSSKCLKTLPRGQGVLFVLLAFQLSGMYITLIPRID